MNGFEKNILKLCKINLSEQEKKELIASLDNKNFWNTLERFSENNQTLPLIYHQLINISRDILIPERFKKTYLLNVKRNILLKEEFSRIKKALLENNIHLLPLKGMNLIEALYSDIGSRYMADIDILIKKEDLPKTIALIEKLGYKIQLRNPAEYQLLCSKILPNQNYFIEIHWEIMPPRPYKIFMPDIWKKDSLSLENNLIITSLHIRRHIRNLELKDFCDILNMLNQKDSHIDYEYLKKISKKNHIASCMSFCVWAVNRVFETNFYQPYKICFFRSKIFDYAFPENAFFDKSGFRPRLLRLFLFDNAIDFIMYVLRVVLYEKTLKKLFYRLSTTG